MGRIAARIAELGLDLPQPWAARGNFLPYRREGTLVFLSGQICEWNGAVTCHGPVGDDPAAIAAAQAAAKVCALNLLHTLQLACDGDLDRVTQFVRVGGFVNCVAGFPHSPQVINAATGVFIDVFGDAGRHARTAVGVAGLPGNAAVEVDAVVAIRAD